MLVYVIIQKMLISNLTNELKNRDNLNTLITENISEAVCTINSEGIIQHASQSYASVIGFNPSEITSKVLYNLIYEKDKDNVRQIFDTIFHSSTEKVFDFRHLKPDGSFIIVEAYARLFSSNETQPEGIILSMRNVSDLRMSELQYFFSRFALDNVQQSVVMINSSGNVVYLNEQTRQMLKKRHMSPKNLKIWDLSPDVEKENWPEYFEYMRKNKYRVISSEIETPVGNIFLERHATYAEFKGKEYIVTNSMDLTRYFKSEEIIRASEQRYKRIIDNIYDVVWVLDMGLKTTFITPSIERLTNYTVEEHIAQSIEEKFTPESAQIIHQWYEYYIPRLSSGVINKESFILRGELQYKRKDGGAIWVEMNVKILMDESGKIIGIHGTSVNIDERKQTELELRSSQKRYKSIFENIIDVYYETTLEGIIIEISPSVETFSKYKREELLGTTLVNFYKMPETRISFLEDIKNKGYVSNYDLILLDKDGREIDCSITARLLTDENGQPYKICGTIRDTTEKRRVEKLIKESEERYKTLVSLSPNPIVVTRNGYFYYVNPSAIRFLGFSKPDELLGKKMIDFIEPKTNDKVINEIAKLSESENCPALELGIINKEGKKLTTLSAIKTISYEGEDSLLFVIQDITQQKQYEEELFQAKQKAEESDKLKTSFLANMSHEIRTPLNGIIGFAGLLKRQNLDKEKQEKYAEIIHSSSHQLLAIINDIIDISKIEAGQMVVYQEAINISHIITELNYIYKSLAEKKNIEFRICPMEDILEISSDEVKLKQILNNLLNNALKFTHKGFIELGYKKQDHEAIFWVRDTGIGIPDDFKRIIFERFRQVEIASNKKYGGTGLGLSISKALVQMLGGRIWLDSEVDKGTTFYFTIPLSVKNKDNSASTLHIANNESIDWHDKTILIVEDESVNSYYFEEILKNTGANLIFADNGKDAIEKFEKIKMIDLVLLDLKLPDIDGFEVLKQLKKLNSEIKVVAQTAFALSNDKKAAISSGFDGYIAKPIEKAELFDLINMLL
jgi:PAS domain S-box-containing protein